MKISLALSRRILRTALCAAALFAAAGGAARAQGVPADPDAASAAAVAPAPAAQPNGLPVQAPPPRTLRAYWHVFIAFALAWLLLFGYLVSVARRFARVERELNALGGA